MNHIYTTISSERLGGILLSLFFCSCNPLTCTFWGGASDGRCPTSLPWDIFCQVKFVCEGGDSGHEFCVCFFVTHVFGSENFDCIDSIICLSVEGVCQRINAAGWRRLGLLPGLVLVGEEGFEISPGLVGRQLWVPEFSGVSKIPSRED